MRLRRRPRTQRGGKAKRLFWPVVMSDESGIMQTDGDGLIVMDGLTKHYGRVAALDSLTLEIRRKEALGLLGPNGSGKTSTLRILLGLLRPNAGWATIAGLDCWHQSLLVRRLVSYLPGELRMYGALSGYGMLKLLCDLREGTGLDRAVAIAERVMKLNLRRK